MQVFKNKNINDFILTAASDEELLWIYGTLEYPRFPEELLLCFGSSDLFCELVTDSRTVLRCRQFHSAH